MSFIIKFTPKVKVFSVIMLACTTMAHGMLETKRRAHVQAEVDQGQGIQLARFEHQPERKGDADARERAEGEMDAGITKIRAIRMYLDRLPSPAKSHTSVFLLPARCIEPFTPVFSAPTEVQFHENETAARSYVYARPFEQYLLNENGTSSKKVLASKNFNDFVVMAFIPALIDNQLVEEVRQSLRNLYEISQRPYIFALRNIPNAHNLCIAAEYVKGNKRWQKVGEPFLKVDPYTVKDNAFVVEKYASGDVKIKISERHLQIISQLSLEQISLIVDLYSLKDPRTRPQRLMNSPVTLSEQQAKTFLSLPLFIKSNLLKNYPLNITTEHAINKNSKAFVRAFRRLAPIAGPLTMQQLQADAQEDENVLSNAEVAVIKELSFAQRELIRDMYTTRGNAGILDNSSYEFVCLPKEMQECLHYNYPLVTMGKIGWTKGMAQKHPKMAIFMSLAAAGTIYVGGPAVVAGAVKTIKAAKAAQAIPTVISAGLKKKGTASMCSLLMAGIGALFRCKSGRPNSLA